MLHEVVEEHVLMAAFLWDVRAMAVRAHHFTLDDLADLEERIDANLDGLRIAGEPGWEIAKSALADREPGAFFTAAVSCIEARDLRGFAAVLDATDEEEPAVRGVESALAWVSPDSAFDLVGPLAHGVPEPLLCRLAISAFASHRRDPGYLLQDALRSPDRPLRVRALRAVGELSRRDLGEALSAGCQSDDPQERFSAAWAGALLGQRGADEVLWSLAAGEHAFSEEAADVAARASAPADARLRIEILSARPGLERVCLRAAGALGDPALLGWVLRALDVPSLARLAAEAASRIVGIAIEGPLRGAAPEGFQEGPNDDPRDSRVAMDPDTFLAWPDVTALRAACSAKAASLPAGRRHVEGEALGEAPLARVLRTGTQLRRAGAAFDLARTGRPLFPVTDRVGRQIAALGGLP